MLPKIKIVSKQSLPPQCPGRTRNQLHLTIGPVEWNPLHSYKPGIDERFYVSVQWWGDKSDGVDLPLSTSRKTTTYYSIKRPQKTLQCYLTDMGTLTLTLHNKDDEVIGAAAVPGIKRLSLENPIREITNIRDSAEGYRLGRLPVTLDIRDLRGRQTTSGSSRSRSRSNSARRSRSRSAPRSRSRSKPEEIKKKSKSERSVNSEAHRAAIGSTIDHLLTKAHTIQDEIRHSVQLDAAENIPPQPARSTPAVNFSNRAAYQVPSIAPIMNRQPFFQNIPPVPVHQPVSTLHIPHTDQVFNIPPSLGQARQLPEIALNIPPLPQITKFYPNRAEFSAPPATTTRTYNKENIQNNAFESYRKALPKQRDLNELILGSHAALDTSLHSVDYVPSEADSLLDEEILDQIYRVHRAAPAEDAARPANISLSPPRLAQNFWLEKNGSIQIEVVEIIIPRKKGRPPPSSTEREIDDSYCIEFTMPWSKSETKSAQLENCRFVSNRMKSGKIIFREDRWYEAVRDVDEPLVITLYHRTKYRSKFSKIEMVEIDPAENIAESINNIEVKIQAYSIRLVIKKLGPMPEPIPDFREQSLPKVSAGGQGLTSLEKFPSQPTVQLFKEMENLPSARSGDTFETSFPISFLLWVKFAEGLPDVREGPGVPGPPLPQLTIRSPLLDEPFTCRVGERSNNPKFNSFTEWTRPILSSELDMLQQSMFAVECWCCTAEQGDKLLGLGRITTNGLASILVGGYALLCAPKFPIIMADGKIPLRDLSSNQVRGYVSVLLAAGTSVQLEHLKSIRNDVKDIAETEDSKNESVISQSLENIEDDEDQATSESSKEVEKVVETISTTSNLHHLLGIPCTISIGHVSNLQIAPNRLVCVSLETQEGLVSTEWSKDGKWNFQKTCVLQDPLPETLVFHLYSCTSHVNSETELNEIQSREFAWIEMSLHTLGIGFPCINGWYGVQSISGETIGQIKLGIAPSSTSPRTFKYPEKSISLQAKLACQPEQLEQSSKILSTQLKELDNLVKTVKLRQNQLVNRTEEIENGNRTDTGTQITPSISRMERKRFPETNQPSLDRLSIAELQNQQIEISVRKITEQHMSRNEILEQDQYISDDSIIDSDADVVQPEVLNSARQLSDLSSKSNPLSSTRIDDSSDIENISEIKETDSDAQIEAMVKEFSASLTSVKQHIDESRKVRSEIENETIPEVEPEIPQQTYNETSVWSGDESISEKSVKSNNTLNDINQIETNFEIVNDINELQPEVKAETVYITCYAKESITEESVDIDQEVLTNNDIDDQSSFENLTTVEHSLSTESEITQKSNSSEIVDENMPKPSAGISLAELAVSNATDAIESIDADIARPPRTKRTLNASQTRRLAAIFGMK